MLDQDFELNTTTSSENPPMIILKNSEIVTDAGKIGLFVRFDNDEEVMMMSQDNGISFHFELQPVVISNIGQYAQLQFRCPNTGKVFSLTCKPID